MDQQQLIQMQALEQEAEALSQQLQIIEQTLSEIKDLGLGLEEIDKKENKEILVNIGKNIYLPVEIKNNNLFVEVGKGTFVKKTGLETKKVIEEQIKKLILGKEGVTKKLDELQQEANELMQNFIMESQREKQKETEGEE